MNQRKQLLRKNTVDGNMSAVNIVLEKSEEVCLYQHAQSCADSYDYIVCLLTNANDLPNIFSKLARDTRFLSGLLLIYIIHNSNT